MKTKVVGQRVKRYDGMAHVTGETRFVDDVIVPGTQTINEDSIGFEFNTINEDAAERRDDAIAHEHRFVDGVGRRSRISRRDNTTRSTPAPATGSKH